jgi:hypothetical protein
MTDESDQELADECKRCAELIRRGVVHAHDRRGRVRSPDGRIVFPAGIECEDHFDLVDTHGELGVLDEDDNARLRHTAEELGCSLGDAWKLQVAKGHEVMRAIAEEEGCSLGDVLRAAIELRRRRADR